MYKEFTPELNEASLGGRRWSIVAPFFTHSGNRWIDDFINDDRFSFRKIPIVRAKGSGWHSRAGRGTPIGDWNGIRRHAGLARVEAPEGIVTVFPQLAMIAGLQNRKRTRNIVAWCFNIGARPSATQLRLARWGFRNVDRFVVHSSGEIKVLSDWFDIEPARIQFVHLQQTSIDIQREEDGDAPFIVAMGSANRDYATLFEAVEGTGIPTRILAASRVLEGLRIPDNVEVLPPMTADQSRAVAQAARISVVPLHHTPTASGQVTVVEAMRMSRPVIATRTVGTRDYIEDRVTGMLTAPADAADLRRAIVEVWEDHRLRARLASAGSDYAKRTFSDEAAGQSLLRILEELPRR